jgi:hypothetical protein
MSTISDFSIMIWAFPPCQQVLNELPALYKADITSQDPVHGYQEDSAVLGECAGIQPVGPQGLDRLL